jgi:hypothetical protein
VLLLLLLSLPPQALLLLVQPELLLLLLLLQLPRGRPLPHLQLLSLLLLAPLLLLLLLLPLLLLLLPRLLLLLLLQLLLLLLLLIPLLLLLLLLVPRLLLLLLLLRLLLLLLLLLLQRRRQQKRGGRERLDRAQWDPTRADEAEAVAPGDEARQQKLPHHPQGAARRHSTDLQHHHPGLLQGCGQRPLGEAWGHPLKHPRATLQGQVATRGDPQGAPGLLP